MVLIATGHVRSKCSEMACVGSSDQKLRIQVTEHDVDTVYCRDNSSALTGRWRVIDRTQELQRPIESREVPERRHRDRTRPIDSDWTRTASNQRARSNGRDDQTRPVRTKAASGQ